MLALLAAPAARAQDDEPRADAPDAKPEPAPISLRIEGPVDAELAPVAGEMTALFYTCYPKLLDRLDNPEHPAPRTIRLKFAPKLDVPAYCSGNTITVSGEWLRQHPEDVGLFTHELTHAVQQYRRAPGWLTEGIADYTRKLYGPESQPGWALPERLNKERHSYKDGYRVTGRFLLWLDGAHPGAVDQIHRKLQAGAFQPSDFEAICGADVDTLWDQCLASLRVPSEGEPADKPADRPAEKSGDDPSR
jgi:hypothetical protein